MKTFRFLMQREFEEHRGTFLWLPLGLAIFLVVSMLAGLALANSNAVQVQIEGTYENGELHSSREISTGVLVGRSLQNLAAMPEAAREHRLTQIYYISAMPLMVALWFVILIYLLGALYDERKDRSILFWKSMPVSDAMTIASKLLTAALVVPAIYLACVFVVELALLLISSVSAMNQSIDVWSTLWAPSHLIGNLFSMAGYMLLDVIWCLPLLAWILFVSSWARSTPIAWATGIPLAFMFFEKIFSSYNFVTSWIKAHSWPAFARHLPDASSAIAHMLSLDMFVSLLIAGAMIYGAIYMRGRTDEL